MRFTVRDGYVETRGGRISALNAREMLDRENPLFPVHGTVKVAERGQGFWYLSAPREYYIGQLGAHVGCMRFTKKDLQKIDRLLKKKGI